MKKQLTEIMRRAGEIVLSAHDTDAGVQAKAGSANFVTEYDRAVQKFLFSELGRLFPDAYFVGEEDGAVDFEKVRLGRSFIIDPIDGTQNFIKHFRHSAISVAMCEDGEVVLGAVLNPYTGELFYAERGKGAFCMEGDTERLLRVSENPLCDGIILFGSSPYRKELHDRSFSVLRTLFDHGLDMRRCGAAALDFCMIADGRAEVYFEMSLYPWDYAAGMLILREAGGTVTSMTGEALPLECRSSVLCGNPRAYRDAAALLSEMK